MTNIGISRWINSISNVSIQVKNCLIIQGCQTSLENWYTDQYMVLFAAGLLLVLVEFMVLLSTLLNCAKIYQYKQECKGSVGVRTPQAMKPSTRQTEEFHRRSPLAAYSNETYALTDSFRQNYKLVDAVWWWLKGLFLPTNKYTLRQNEIESMLWWDSTKYGRFKMNFLLYYVYNIPWMLTI